jgi:glycosyltransferase 2 family protein
MDQAQTKRHTFWRILRVLASVLTLLSIALVGVWLYTHREELKEVQWSQQWPVFLLLIGMYGISFVFEFIVWHSYLRLIKPIPWLRNLRLYAYSNLSRRLPSGFGYLFVRAVQYQSEGIDSATTLYFSVQELMLLVVTGAVIAIITLSKYFDPVAIILGPLLAALTIFVFRPKLLAILLRKITFGRLTLLALSQPVSKRMAIGWIILYWGAWVNGGIMLFFLLLSFTGTASVNMLESIGLWSSSATLGLVSGLLPAGQLVRDVSLSIMLQNYAPLSIAILVAISFRFVITIGDIIWSFILYGFTSVILKWYCSKEI